MHIKYFGKQSRGTFTFSNPRLERKNESQYGTLSASLKFHGCISEMCTHLDNNHGQKTKDILRTFKLSGIFINKIPKSAMKDMQTVLYTIKM